MTSPSGNFRFGPSILVLGCALAFPTMGCAATGGSEIDAGKSDATSSQAVQAGPAALRLRTELRLLLLELVESGAFGDVPAERITLDLEMPAERFATLGLLVDSRSGANAGAGLVVLGTTPGGFADALGVRGGDVIVAFNDTSLVALGNDEKGSARAAGVLRQKFDNLADGSDVRLKLRRDDKERVVTGRVRKILTPAVHLIIGNPQSKQPIATADSKIGMPGGCGRISIFDSAPPQQDLHPVTLISIDGKDSPFDGQTSFRVPIGSHVVAVAENVDARYLGFNSRLRDNQGRSRYKSLTIEVKADTTYRLATHILPEHRNEWRDGAWWEPVVWSESSEACR